MVEKEMLMRIKLFARNGFSVYGDIHLALRSVAYRKMEVIEVFVQDWIMATS